MSTSYTALAVCMCAFVGAVAGVGVSGGSPQQVHIAFRGQDYDMAVSWWTTNTTRSVVMFGETQSLGSTATGVTGTYDSASGYTHNTILEGLKPSTVYYYKAGDPAAGWSNVFSFTTAPPESRDSKFSIAVYGDMGVTNSENTVAQLKDKLGTFDWFLHCGDFSYADDRLSGYEDIWNQWMTEMEPIMSGKAYMVNPGNHEATCHSFGDFFCNDDFKNFTAYNNRFRMPAVESKSGTNMWHSFNYGNAHFTMIDTETDYPKAPEGKDTIWQAGGFGRQLEWLAADLKNAVANREKYPWIIVVGHRPMYTADIRGLERIIWPNITGALRESIEDLLYDANVDMYISGHVHAYERQWPVYRGVPEHTYDNPRAATQTVVGMAGNIEGPTTKFNESRPWHVYDSHEYGYCRLTILNSTHLTWEYHRATDDAILDRIILDRTQAHALAHF